MKRIALFSITYHPFIGGAEIAIKEVTDRLGSEKFSARGGPAFGWDLFTARLNVRLSREERIGNVNVFRVGSGRPLLDKLLYPWRASRLALRMHDKKPYDLVHAVLETYAGLAALLFKRKRPLVPYVLTLQSGDPDEFIRKKTWFWSRWYRQVYTRADRVTAISLWLAARAKRYGFRGSVEIIPNGVDIAHFGGEMRNDEREFVRRSWGAGEKDFLAITASRLVRKNGIDILIASLAYLPQGVKLVIAGGGEDEAALRAQSKSFPGRVVFLGEMGHKDLPRVLKACDAFARPSRSEGLGNSFLEAMAAGIPVVGTPVGGIVDFLKDGETGLLAQAENPKSVAEKINQLATDKGLCKTLARNAQALAVSRYDWEGIAAQYGRIYQQSLQPNVPQA